MALLVDEQRLRKHLENAFYAGADRVLNGGGLKPGGLIEEIIEDCKKDLTRHP